MKLFSTRTHGLLDYLSVGTLLALPRMLGWNRETTRMLTGAALGTLVYSLTTNYELGLVKKLPMPAHLGLDAMSGLMLCLGPLMLDDSPSTERALIGLGLFEIAASLLTETTPRGT